MNTSPTFYRTKPTQQSKDNSCVTSPNRFTWPLVVLFVISFAALMQAFGHVQLIQTDGGSEFKAECGAGMHLWANRHRIARAYKKNEQAFIEAFNGTVRREALGYPQYRADQLAEAQHAVDEFLTYYHQRRPHLSLNMLTPAHFAESHLL